MRNRSLQTQLKSKFSPVDFCAIIKLDVIRPSLPSNISNPIVISAKDSLAMMVTGRFFSFGCNVCARSQSLRRQSFLYSYQKHEVVTDGLVLRAASCMQPSGGLNGCCCLCCLPPPPLLDNEPLALSCCQSGRQTGLRSGHRRLVPSGSVWVARTATLPAEGHGIRSDTHWTTDKLPFGPKYLWKGFADTRLPFENRCDSWRLGEGVLAFVASF